MNNENRMEQHYAVSKGGVLVHINEAHGSKEDCFCPYCGDRMIKRCGNIRTWHFAHKYRDDKKCSYESYLHAFAKLKLKQWFEESTSLTLHYQQPISCQFVKDCIWRKYGDECSRLDEKSIDLKKHLTCCSVEETIHTDDAMFRADLLWSNPDNTKNDILVEIKVTHECTQKKKESQKRIIEFEVHSEEDVEYIVANDIRESDTVRYYGFSPKNVKDENIQPRHLLSKFIYYSTGKAFASSECNCRTFRNRRKSALLEITVRNTYNHLRNELLEWQGSPKNFSFGRFYNWGLALAKSKGYVVRNCYLCSHHCYDYDNDKLICELLPDEMCEAVAAKSCNNYILNEELYQKNIDEFTKFSKNNIVDVWSKQ